MSKDGIAEARATMRAIGAELRASATAGEGDVITPRVRVKRLREQPTAHESKTGQRKREARGPDAAIIGVSCLKRDLALVDAAAEAAGMSRSSYLIECALAGAGGDVLRMRLEAAKRRIGE